MSKPVTGPAANISAADMDAERMVTYPTEAFLSREYLEGEKKMLWPKVWQMVKRESDLPNPGDWMTYNVADESVIVLRKADGTLKAFHNVCPHRGRKLVSVPDMLPGKVHDVRGNQRRNFVCGFHGWTFNQNGENIRILDQPDWHDGLTPEMTRLSTIKVDTWGGWIYINMDPHCVPLREWMGRAGEILDCSSCRRCANWRQWAIYPCNWKTAIEAFRSPTTSRRRNLSCWPAVTTMLVRSRTDCIACLATIRAKRNSKCSEVPERSVPAKGTILASRPTN